MDRSDIDLQRLVRRFRRPWVASSQYGMRFLLSADNQIILRDDKIPITLFRAMAKEANDFEPNVKAHESSEQSTKDQNE